MVELLDMFVEMFAQVTPTIARSTGGQQADEAGQELVLSPSIDRTANFWAKAGVVASTRPRRRTRLVAYLEGKLDLVLVMSVNRAFWPRRLFQIFLDSAAMA